MCLRLIVLLYDTQAQLDYSVDSDDEWEEEDPGESISNSEVAITTHNYSVLLYTCICINIATSFCQ